MDSRDEENHLIASIQVSKQALGQEEGCAQEAGKDSEIEGIENDQQSRLHTPCHATYTYRLSEDALPTILQTTRNLMKVSLSLSLSLSLP